MPARRAIRAAAGLAATLALTAVLAAPAAAAPQAGYIVTQREGKSVSRLALTPTGLRFDSFTAARKGAAAKLDVSLLIRYRDQHLFLLTRPAASTTPSRSPGPSQLHPGAQGLRSRAAVGEAACQAGDEAAGQAPLRLPPRSSDR